VPKSRKRQLTVLRQFFLARPNPGAWPPPRPGPHQPDGHLGRQRALFRRWTIGTDAHEALLGILALLHGASSSEVRRLQDAIIDPDTRAIRLGNRARRRA